MRIAIPVREAAEDSGLSLKFSRSPWFLIIDREKNTRETIRNPYAEEKVMAGSRIFNMLINEMKVDTFMAFELGLKVQQMAVKNKIQLIITDNTELNLKDKLLKH
ncbi:MAG: NifB/NifX family molybdenum-iron cluster-binding protein [Bacteroidales bacterium]|nr:NifB/NifX family molybdenum-iron cluster-binding protein [Bacteroidales bacterium]